MHLPAMDVGLMDEHLAAHEGILYKLRKYEEIVNDPYVRKLLKDQIIIMMDHVRVMLALLDPERDAWVSLATTNPEVDTALINQSTMNPNLKRIVAELVATSKQMASDNYTSALRMKNDNVKHVHFQMAMQQATFQNYYAFFMEKMGWNVSPKAVLADQAKVVQHFKHLLN
ncbi:hypothetical protein NC661_15105 [Aquibacillus koreensis]|uniref:Spore coat protein n=1 Tax=Aquibacillus koreensis TaxID=279446 RepID=A0A9X3WL43_9BACI|nr:hypothetical protein [Aquibacillus koreensis]MCT2534393.1 hypothetical protein [Aquibacillus koreensis]MDC3421700.1 hypothetical protein [Aquibacillus koreensis]